MFQFLLELFPILGDTFLFRDTKEKRARRMIKKLLKEEWFADYYEQPLYKEALYQDTKMRDKLSSYRFVGDLYRNPEAREAFLRDWTILLGL